MKAILYEVFYIICGLIAFYNGVSTLKDKKHNAKVGTAVFWISLGIVLAFGKWLPSMVSGILIVVMALPAMFNRVSIGKVIATSQEYMHNASDKIGNYIFIPALTSGATALIFAIFIPKLGALVGFGVGAVLASIFALGITKESPNQVMNEGKRLLEAVGPLSMLPQLLASLGAIFTAAGVGEVISGGVGRIIPEGNVTIGIIVYCVSMALFTMVMGNAFAAFSVITVGIGVPFVFQYGLDPSIVGILALTSGYCGTLMTPMAANFNIVPVAVLEMKDKYGVIKKQIPIAICLLVFQIILIHVLG